MSKYTPIILKIGTMVPWACTSRRFFVFSKKLRVISLFVAILGLSRILVQVFQVKSKLCPGLFFMVSLGYTTHSKAISPRGVYAEINTFRVVLLFVAFLGLSRILVQIF